MADTAGFWHSLKREVRTVSEKPWDCALLVWVPMLAVALLCWIFSAGIPRHLPIAVWNEDHGSSISRTLTRWLDADPGITVKMTADNAAEAKWAVDSMYVDALVHIPPHTERDVLRGKGGHIDVLYNAQLLSQGGMIQRDVNHVVQSLSATLAVKAAMARGVPFQEAKAATRPIDVTLYPLFNVSTNYEAFLAFSLIPSMLHVLAVTAGAYTVGREIRDHQLVPWLTMRTDFYGRVHPGRFVGPLSPPDYLSVLAAVAGKLCVPWILLTLVAWSGFTYLTAIRGWHAVGSLGMVYLAVTLLIAVSVVLGAFLAAVTMSLRKGLSGSAIISSPSFTYSGTGFPLMAMSEGAHRWAISMPYTHYIRFQIEQLQMGAPISQGLPILCGLSTAGLVLLLLCALCVRRAWRRPDRWGTR